MPTRSKVLRRRRQTSGIPLRMESPSPGQDYIFDYLTDGVIQKAYDCFASPYRVVCRDATPRRLCGAQYETQFYRRSERLDQTRIQQNEEWLPAPARQSIGACDGGEDTTLGTVCPRKGNKILSKLGSNCLPDLQKRVCCYIVGDRQVNTARDCTPVAQLPSELREPDASRSRTSNRTILSSCGPVCVHIIAARKLPRVVLEAMAYGGPDCDDSRIWIREQVREGVNALFYEAGDSGALADRLRRLLPGRGTAASFSLEERQRPGARD